jgi:Flp pilus assembly pilin Flp
MSESKTIRARVELPCTIQLSNSRAETAYGVTEELARESLIVVVPSGLCCNWLREAAELSMAIELPSDGRYEPRALECAATVLRSRSVGAGLRLNAAVHRMSFINSEPAIRFKNRAVAGLCAVESINAIRQSPTLHPVIRKNPPTNSAGEHSVSFLKSFFVEEDGQDMVEYGLVIALVVLAAAGGYTAFQVQINAALTTLGNSIKAAL